LGTFDTRFNISQEYFLSAIADAEAIWEKPLGKNLFSYLIEGPYEKVLKINLAYDYRQQTTGKLADIGVSVTENQSSYDTLKNKFEVLKISYETEQKVFRADLQVYNQEWQDYQSKVNTWNKKGGAPKPEYDKLEAERLVLDAKSKDLQIRQEKINDMVDKINALVVALNRLAGVLNISVNKYNTVGASRGESFEEGLYRSDGSGRNIDVYEFNNRTKLVRVLAHELGHALDLGHVVDPEAIMYEFNQSDNKVLTDADLIILKTKCKVE